MSNHATYIWYLCTLIYYNISRLLLHNLWDEFLNRLKLVMWPSHYLVIHLTTCSTSTIQVESGTLLNHKGMHGVSILESTMICTMHNFLFFIHYMTASQSNVRFLHLRHHRSQSHYTRPLVLYHVRRLVKRTRNNWKDLDLNVRIEPKIIIVIIKILWKSQYEIQGGMSSLYKRHQGIWYKVSKYKD